MNARLLVAVLFAVATVPLAARAQQPVQGETGRPVLVLDGQGFTTNVTSLDFSPDGRWLAAGGWDRVVRIWDVKTGELLWTLRGERGDGGVGEVNAVRFSPDGRELLVAAISLKRGQSVRIYKTDNFDEIAGTLEGVGATVGQLAFDRDLQVLATGDSESKITFWDWRTRKPLRTVQVVIVPSDLQFHLPGVLTYTDYTGSKGHVPNLELGRKGFILSVDRYQREFKIDDPAKVKQEHARRPLEELDNLATAVSQALASEGPKETLPYSGLKAEGWHLRFDLNRLFAAGKGTRANGASLFWAGAKPLEGGQWAYYDKHRYSITALRSSPDGKLAATADLFGEVHIWDAHTGKSRHQFRGLARPLYNVAFDQTGTRLGFGSTPHKANRWKLNEYGEIHRGFDFTTRRLSDQLEFDVLPRELRRGDRTLEIEIDKTVARLGWVVCKRNGKDEARVAVSLDLPACYGFLNVKDSPFGDLFFVGTQGGFLRAHDATSMYRRSFRGHTVFVTGAASTADGRFLASTSTDGVIRLYSLENFRPLAMPDCFLAGSFINQFLPGSAAQKAGFQLGDRVVTIGNHTIEELFELMRAQNWPFKAGQRVKLSVVRHDGKPFSAEVPLIDTMDSVDPLLSLFIARDNEWVAWTPEGYFDSSLGGDRLIGWHVNQGSLKAAKFFPVHQFRKEFYRPDIIDQVLQTGATPLVAGTSSTDKTPVVDLRNAQALAEREPPKVRITRPRNNTRVRTEKIVVEVEITRSNNLPVTEATFLVGSRPQATADLQKENQDALVYEQEVTLLPGSNKISVLAANDVSHSLPASITVTYEPAAAQVQKTILPDLYVLSVGVSKYKNTDFDLKFAHTDATEFAKTWEQQAGHPYRKVETRVVTDEKATASNILTEMEWLVRNCTQSDVAVLFFSAHGMRDTRNSYYLATHDINPDNLRGTGVRWTEVTELLKDLKGKVLVFVDTCHAGAITGESRKALNVDDPLRDLVSDDVGAVVFSSSLPREVSLELQQHGHGAFTKALLDAFGDKASDQDQDGYLSVTEMQFQVEQRVKQLTSGAQHPSTQRSTSMPSFNFYGYPKAD